jgi:hypothetical protein
MPTLTHEIIEAAIAGFEGQKHKIDAQIAELRAMLSGTPAAAPVAHTTAPTKAARGGKRKFSAEAIKRMREAQQRRWAKIKGTSESPAQETTAKRRRKMSAAGRKAIAAAQKKRWAMKKAGA